MHTISAADAMVWPFPQNQSPDCPELGRILIALETGTVVRLALRVIKGCPAAFP